MSLDGDGDVEKVGYGRPPVRTRFQPGRSGNPRGRPRATASIPQLISRELGNTVAVTEGNRKLTLKKRQALAKRIVGDALSGKRNALAIVLGADREILATLEKVASALASEHDDLTRATLAERIRGMLETRTPGPDEEASS